MALDDKHRNLPSWMLGEEAKRKEHEEFGKRVKTRVKNKTRLKRETLYFMNEAELVDAALRVLAEGPGENSGAGTGTLQTGAEKCTGEWPPVKKDRVFIIRKRKTMFESDSAGESSDCELNKKSCIFETDLEDLAGKETLPYAEHGLKHRETAGVSKLDTEELVIPRPGLAPEVDQTSPSSDISDDDALRLVREIFFT
ncbi:hypothetical protein GJAV_G00166730 [Gymnothorax javanicus]|nr:hypothetical protein GJAV_G00166730 [Gymnothorax javanicus]